MYIIALFPSRQYSIDDYPSVRDYLLSAEWNNEIPDGFGKLKLDQTGRKHTINGVTFTARKKTSNKWFETQDQIGYWDDFSKQKIIFQEIVQEPSFMLDSEGRFFCLDTGRIITGNNLFYLLPVLNSKLFFYAVKQFYGGGGLGDTGVRMKHTFFGKFPCVELSHIVKQRAYALIKLGNSLEIDMLIYEQYDLTKEEVLFIESQQTQ